MVARAAPDGDTILLATSSTHSIGPALNPKMPYDAFKDFAPVSHLANASSVLVVGKDFPAATARELVDLLKKNPGKYNFGSSGIGTYPHLAAEMFKWRAGGLYVVHIPYRGTGLVITDLVAGQIAFLMDSIVSAQSHIKNGKVRALAVSGARRSSKLPEVVQRLNRELNAIVKAADVIERLERVGAEAVGSTPEQFAQT